MNGHPEPSSKLALISVSDKSGITEFARRLTGFGFSILSTGGTARTLADAGIEVAEVSEFTGFPEIMDGRVKTLHPRIHGGLLGRPGRDEAAMSQQNIPHIALAVINLYPFEEVICKPGTTLEEAIENIDIGGPAMVRSAAKNHAAVGVVTSPGQYAEVLAQLERNRGELGEAFRFELAVAAFNRIAQYDAAISNYLSGLQPGGQASSFPRQANGCFQKVMDLRYGENPHQAAAFYRNPLADDGGVAGARQLQGKELSFNNIADADAAWTCVKQFEQPACVIVKHANPCGVAVDTQPLAAYRKAHATDRMSAFGGVIAFNCEVDEAAARDIMDRQFVEVLVAPAVSPAAVRALAQKPNLRVLEIAPAQAPKPTSPRLDFRRVGGGVLIQWADDATLAREACRVVSRQQPDEAQWADLLFAWRVVKMVKSNAIVFAAGGQTLGIGAGQMSRVDSTRIARWKAGESGLELRGSVMASDAFFPFRDSIDNAAEAGIACIIQPGGSVRDDEVIAAADEHGLAMVFTGMRHFRH